MAQTVLITGSSSGIGRAAAELFQEQGWQVAAIMRSPSKAGDLEGRDGLLVFRLDVTDQDTIDQAIAAAIERFGSIDVVVNNAGYAAFGPFEAASEEQIQRQFDTNIYGVLRVIRTALPHLRKQRSGTLINISSIGGRVGIPLNTLYHATKFALEGFTESLHYELEPFGVKVPSDN